jgi:hypothetical protein
LAVIFEHDEELAHALTSMLRYLVPSFEGA